MSKPNFKVCLECPLEHCVEEWTKDEFGSQGSHGRLPSREIELSQISRLDVARAVHCVPKHISQIFMGKGLPSLPLAYDIAKYLGTTIDYLYQAISGANGTNPSACGHFSSSDKISNPWPPRQLRLVKWCNLVCACLELNV